MNLYDSLQNVAYFWKLFFISEKCVNIGKEWEAQVANLCDCAAGVESAVGNGKCRRKLMLPGEMSRPERSEGARRAERSGTANCD